MQHEGGDTVDAGVLLMPLLKFVAPNDPRFVSTLAEIEKRLVTDSLVFRYDHDHSPDGLDGGEGTFSLCSFWYVEALTRLGRLDDARLALEKMFTYANHLGLYAEQVGLTGEQLGNFPQAFTHLSLISAAHQPRPRARLTPSTAPVSPARHGAVDGCQQDARARPPGLARACYGNGPTRTTRNSHAGPGPTLGLRPPDSSVAVVACDVRGIPFVVGELGIAVGELGRLGEAGVVRVDSGIGGQVVAGGRRSGCGHVRPVPAGGPP